VSQTQILLPNSGHTTSFAGGDHGFWNCDSILAMLGTVPMWTYVNYQNVFLFGG